MSMFLQERYHLYKFRSNKHLCLYPNFNAFQDLGTAGATKRPTSCMLILPKPLKGEIDKEEEKKFKESYDEVVDEIEELSAETLKAFRTIS